MNIKDEDVDVLSAEVNEMKLKIQELTCEWGREREENRNLGRQEDIAKINEIFNENKDFEDKLAQTKQEIERIK